MPTEEHDSWLSSAFGVAVDKLRSAAQTVADDASSAVQSAEDLAGQAVDAGAGALSAGGAAVSSAVSTIKSAASKVVNEGRRAVQSVVDGGDSGPMLADCRPVHGHVPGPASHLLCETHGHILDINAKQIIAASLDDYKARFPSGQDAKRAAEDAEERARKAADGAEKTIDEGEEKVVAAAKEAARLAEDLALRVKDLGVAIAKDTEGCRLQAAAIAAGVVTFSVGLAAIIFPAPADASPAAPAAAGVQLAGIVTAVMGFVGLAAAIASYINCKEDQLDTLAKEAAQKREDAELNEKVRKLQQQIDDIKNRKQDLQNSVDRIRSLAQ
jgi:hypothetical protein